MSSAVSGARLDLAVRRLRAAKTTEDMVSDEPALASELLEELQVWSDRELEELEDELDFYTFTGTPGPHLRKLLHLF